MAGRGRGDGSREEQGGHGDGDRHRDGVAGDRHGALVTGRGQVLFGSGDRLDPVEIRLAVGADRLRDLLAAGPGGVGGDVLGLGERVELTAAVVDEADGDEHDRHEDDDANRD
jgi:hypothetical protein